MDALVPNRFLIRAELSLHYFAEPPPLAGSVDKWPEAARLPALCELDHAKPFADVYAGWNRDGLFVGVRVRGKSKPPSCETDQFWRGDNVRVMTDMRDTRNIRRATRFCQHFYLLPVGGGKSGKTAIGGGAKINRATEDSPIARPEQLIVASKVIRGGYDLTAHLTADALNGFDPGENPRIGLFVLVEDLELGQQSLTVGDEMNWNIDPSTWLSIRLEVRNAE
jgi:hypothetical protein